MLSIQSIRRLPRSLLSQRNFCEKATVRAKAEDVTAKTGMPEGLAQKPEVPEFFGSVPKSYDEFLKLPQLDPKFVTEQFNKVVDRSKGAIQGVVDTKLVAEQFNKVVDRSKGAIQGIVDPKLVTELFSGGGQPMVLVAVAGSGLGLLWSFAREKSNSDPVADTLVALPDVNPASTAFERYPMSQFSEMAATEPCIEESVPTLAAREVSGPLALEAATTMDVAVATSARGRATKGVAQALANLASLAPSAAMELVGDGAMVQ